LSGQITPFLLIILAILLVAAISTVNIGRVSIDKTCSSNGADAGALASASAWSGALNNLCDWNKSMKTFFDQNYYTYGQLQDEADDYADEALLWNVAAAVETSISVSAGPAVCGSVYVGGIIAGAAELLGATMLFEAYQATTSLVATLEYMKSLTENFHEQQWKAYCDARDYMAEAYIDSRKAGLSYAFSNSCISAKLTNEQSDLYNAWLAGDGSWHETGSSGVYSWSDNAVATHAAGVDITTPNHTVSVSLTLPNIASYNLKHTNGSYSAIIDKLEDVIDEATTYASVQYSTATVMGAAAAIFFVAVVLSIVTVALQCCFPWTAAAYGVVCGILEFISAEVITQSELLNTIVAALVNVSAITIAALLATLDTDPAFGLWGPDGTQASSSCDDAEDLMIEKIDSLNIPVANPALWDKAVCTVSQQHPATSVGIVPTSYPEISSTSRAKFSGGDVGNFEANYDPSLTSTG